MDIRYEIIRNLALKWCIFKFTGEGVNPTVHRFEAVLNKMLMCSRNFFADSVKWIHHILCSMVYKEWVIDVLYDLSFYNISR